MMTSTYREEGNEAKAETSWKETKWNSWWLNYLNNKNITNGFNEGINKSSTSAIIIMSYILIGSNDNNSNAWEWAVRPMLLTRQMMVMARRGSAGGILGKRRLCWYSGRGWRLLRETFSYLKAVMLLALIRRVAGYCLNKAWKNIIIMRNINLRAYNDIFNESMWKEI